MENEVPLNTDMNAERWAREFNDALQTVYPGVAQDRLDEDWLRAWFANAIMCGHDNARWEYTCPASGGSVKPLRSEVEECIGALEEFVLALREVDDYPAQDRAEAKARAVLAKYGREPQEER